MELKRYQLSLETINFDALKYSYFLAIDNIVYMARNPRIVKSYNQQFTIFHLHIWLLIILIVFVMASTFKTIYSVYGKLDEKYGLLIPVTHQIDFLLLPFASLTEPDPIPWFPRFSTGKREEFQNPV